MRCSPVSPLRLQAARTLRCAADCARRLPEPRGPTAEFELVGETPIGDPRCLPNQVSCECVCVCVCVCLCLCACVCVRVCVRV